MNVNVWKEKRNKNTIENTPLLKFSLIDIQNYEYQNIKIDKNDKTTSLRSTGMERKYTQLELNEMIIYLLGRVNL